MTTLQQVMRLLGELNPNRPYSSVQISVMLSGQVDASAYLHEETSPKLVGAIHVRRHDSNDEKALLDLAEAIRAHAWKAPL
jgi:hypothetical protein